MTILAIDPGLTSGWAMHYGLTDTFSAGELEFEPLCRWVDELAEAQGQYLTLVSESFHITQATTRKSQAPWSLEIIGVLKYLCLRYGLEPLTLQQPSAAKSFVDNAKLRALGYWTKGGGGHANDAARHLILYRVNHGWRDPRAL